MSDSTAELAQLLERLSFARSNWERAQLLFQSWKKVRALSPQEREMLALHLGIDGAEDLIGKLVETKTGKKSPPELMAALRSLEKEDPQKLARLMESLQNPTTFQNRQVISDALERVGGRMAEAALEAHAPPAAAQPLFGSQTQPATSPSLASAQALPVPDPSTVGALPVAPAAPDLPSTNPAIPSARAGRPLSQPPPAAPMEEELPTVAATPAASRRAAAAAAGAHDSPTSSATPAAQIRAATPPSDGAWMRMRSREHDGERDDADEHDDGEPRGGRASPGARLVARLRGPEQLIHRFRLLHEAGAQLAFVDDDGCDQILEAFPPGWARRRALTALLEAGGYHDAGRAERAIAQLESPAARRACQRLLLARG